MFVLHAGMVVQAVFALRWMPFSRVRRMPVSCVRLSKAPTVAIDESHCLRQCSVPVFRGHFVTIAIHDVVENSEFSSCHR
jgi:hypothetical protein